MPPLPPRPSLARYRRGHRQRPSPSGSTIPPPIPCPTARLTFDIYGQPRAKGVNADQIYLSYSTSGPNGSFASVPLNGSTGGGGVIEAPVGPEQGTTLAPHATRTYTFHVALADSVPASKTAGPIIAFEGYLDQINPASGSGDTLADTYGTDIRVPTAASQSDTLRNVLIGIGAAAVVALVILWRRRQSHPQGPTAGPATS